jgi:Zn-dependent protease
MRIVFTKKEVKEILISAIVLSIAFSLAYSHGIFNLQFGGLPILIAFSFVAVGIGFLAHELIGHKIVAQKLGLHAEYKMWNLGLLVALLSSLAGFVFAAPGAVYVSSKMDLWGNSGVISKKRMGIVSVAGPIINIFVASVFLILSVINPLTIGGIEVFQIGVFVNVWLALFNMLPIPPLDGSKVLAWDKRAYVLMFAVCVAFFLLLVF